MMTGKSVPYGMAALGALLLAAGLPAVGATVRATSGDVSIDTRAIKECSVGAAISVPYDARWCAGSAAVDHGRVTVVTAIDEGATNRTSTVASLTAASGTCSYTRSSGDPGTMRFKLSYYDSDDALVGEELSGDLTYCLSAAVGTAACVDARTNSLQAVAEAGGPAVLTFDRAWVTNGTAARVAMHCVCDRRRKNGTLVSSVTNEIFQTSEFVSGDFAHAINPGNGGTFTLSCSFFDDAGKLLETPLTASYYFPEKFGLLLLVK